jgi:hypothetical protein
MLEWYPYVPVGGEMAMNCAILSYNGITYFGFSGDVHAVPDLNRLESLLMESLAELQRATGIHPPAKAARKPTRKNPVVRRRATASAAAQPLAQPDARTQQTSVRTHEAMSMVAAD